MKKQNVFMMLVASACVSLAAFTVRAQVTIEAYGDSITTHGAAPESSYRYWLYEDLADAGYDTNAFTFIGTESGAENGTPANSWPDEAYAGYDGWDTGSAVDNISGAISAGVGGDGPPAIVLLEFGANDAGDYINGYSTPEQTEANLETVIQDFAAANSSVVILMATAPRYLTTPGPLQNQANSDIAKVNNAIHKVASVEKKAGVDVTVVSFGGYNPRTDTSDGTHPNVKGEQYLAKQYFDALRPVLKKMGVEPQKQSKH
jgi:lysophospholipase L1-like esterase